MLCRLLLLEQAAVSNGELPDLLPAFDEGRVLSEVGVGD